MVLILDKKKTTLPVQSSTRYRLGVVEVEISPRYFKIRYAQPSQNGKINITTCESSIQGLSLIVRKEDFKPSEKEFFLDPVFPPGRLVEELQPTNKKLRSTDRIGNEMSQHTRKHEQSSVSLRGKVIVKFENQPKHGCIHDMVT